MMPRSHLTHPAPLLALALLGACTNAASTPAASTPAPVFVNATPAEVAAVDSLRRTVTPADVEFMSMMIGHHAQAIQMSEMAATHDAGPEVRVLAARIINAQHDEIATMQRWLRDHGKPVPAVEPGYRMVMNGQEHVMLMPGMLTAEQMAALDAARGRAFDQLFLTGMIQHHRGAMSMVEELFRHDGAGQEDVIFKFASDVNVDQTTEVERMRKMLFAMNFGVTGP